MTDPGYSLRRCGQKVSGWPAGDVPRYPASREAAGPGRARLGTSLAGTGPPGRRPPRPGERSCAKDRPVRWPEPMSPGVALEGLRAQLAARGLAAAGMTITRWQGVLTLADGPDVGYRCGWLFWPAGRRSRSGRLLYAVHRAGDPAGAARRLALPWPRDGQREAARPGPPRHAPDGGGDAVRKSRKAGRHDRLGAEHGTV
jgi:hypothetical protein